MPLATQEAVQFERRAIIAALSWLCDPLRTMDNLHTGDLVQLKAGGPTMSIARITGDGLVSCQWFAKDDTLQEAVFRQEQLKKADAGSGSKQSPLNL